MNIYVEHLKFKPKSNVDKFYHKQKLETTAWQCVHPKRHIINIDVLNPLIDEMENHKFCTACDTIVD